MLKLWSKYNYQYIQYSLRSRSMWYKNVMLYRGTYTLVWCEVGLSWPKLVAHICCNIQYYKFCRTVINIFYCLLTFLCIYITRNHQQISSIKLYMWYKAPSCSCKRLPTGCLWRLYRSNKIKYIFISLLHKRSHDTWLIEVNIVITFYDVSHYVHTSTEVTSFTSCN